MRFDSPGFTRRRDPAGRGQENAALQRVWVVAKVIAAVGVCSLIVACGSSSKSSTTSAPSTSSSAPAATTTGSSSTPAASAGGLSGNLKMTVFTFSADVMKPVIAGFEKLNPNVHVTSSVVSNGNTYVPLLQTEKLGGTLPDIAETYDVLTPTLETDHLLTNLSPFLAKGQPYPKNYWLSTFMASYIPPAGAPDGVGNVYALPNEADATVIFYNKNEFKAAGVPFPTNGWTWNQMLADAAKLSKPSSNHYGICERPDWQAEYNPILKAFGVTGFTETAANLASAPAQKAWQLMIGPLQKGLAVPESQLVAEGDNDCTPLFTSGEAAMSIEVRGNLPSVQSGVGSKFAYDVVPMPSIPGPSGTAVVPTGGGSVGWTLTSGVKNTPNALAFLKYLFSATGQAVAEKTFGVVPAVGSLNGPTALWRTQKGGPANSSAFVIAANSATIAPQTPGRVFTLSNTAIPNAVEEVTQHGMSIAAAFGSLQSQMKSAYAQAKG
jgi:multiple sugar transport system substrate-binding protein